MKLKPHKGVYKIPIHKHTPVRRRPSIHSFELLTGLGNSRARDIMYPLVTDLIPPELNKVDQLINRAFDILSDPTSYQLPYKPSLWKRIKRKVKR